MREDAGFTLAELMVVVVVTTILLSVAVPSFQYVTTSNRLSAETNSLLDDIQYARAEAVKEGQSVTVCPSTDGNSCANSSAWQTGWIVFSDLNNTGKVDEGDPVLRIRNAFVGSDTLQTDGSVRFITFNRGGFATPDTTLTLQDQTGNAQRVRCLEVTPAGPGVIQTDAASGACK
jgi:type IV fimbrial biogenesis protein FimT